MITDVKILTYLLVSGTGLSNGEYLTATNSIYDDLVEDDYELDYILEFGDEFTFAGSSVNMEFFASDTLDTIVTNSEFTNNRFFGIEIYIDNGTTPEFWGYLDSRTIEKDTDKNTWKFTVVDWMDRYWKQWEQQDIPYSTGDTITTWLEKIIDGLLIEGVTVDVGDMQQTLLMAYYRTHIYPNANSKYFVSNHLKELQKHYGAYVFVTPDKKLNFINRMRTNSGTKVISDTINIIESGFEPKPYKAIAISYINAGVALGDPDVDTATDGDYIILGDGSAKWIPMPYLNGVDIDDFDRALNEQYPAYRFNYLDLRQRMPAFDGLNPYQMLTWNPVSEERIAKRYGGYKNIFNDTTVLTVEVSGYDYDLLDKVNLTADDDVTSYLVLGVKKYLTTERAILTLREVV